MQRSNAGREDTTAPEYRRHPPRSNLTRAEHGKPGTVLAAWGRLGRPTVRKAEFCAGNKIPKKRMPVMPGTASPAPGSSSAAVDESRQETRGGRERVHANQ
jgi:hypothetical protein